MHLISHNLPQSIVCECHLYADRAMHAGAAGLKLVEIPELSESKATADSPISAHTKVRYACFCPRQFRNMQSCC